MAKQFVGGAYELTFTLSGGSSVTVTELESGSYDDESELGKEENVMPDTGQKFVTFSSTGASITAQTYDWAALATVVSGTRVTSATIKFRAPKTSVGTTPSNVVQATISHGILTLKRNPDKSKPGTIDITITSCLDETASAATTFGMTASGS